MMKLTGRYLLLPKPNFRSTIIFNSIDKFVIFYCFM